MVRTVKREHSNEGNDVDTIVITFLWIVSFFFFFFFFERRIINFYDFNFDGCVCGAVGRAYGRTDVSTQEFKPSQNLYSVLRIKIARKCVRSTAA